MSFDPSEAKIPEGGKVNVGELLKEIRQQRSPQPKKQLNLV